MDCSQFADSLTPEAHGVLQIIQRKQDPRNVYKNGISPLLKWLAPSEALAALGLLQDAGALRTHQERGENIEGVFDVVATCGCDQRWLQGKTPARSNIALSLDSQLTSATKLVTNVCDVIRSSPTNRRGTPSESGLIEVDTSSFGEGPATGWNAKVPEHWNASDLADYFSSQLTTVVVRQRQSIAAQVNMGALRKNFSHWRRDGWDSPVIKEMIDAFCANPEKWCRNGTPMWRAFVANSTRLHIRVAKKVERERIEDAPEAVVGMVARRRLARQGR